jgi:hypothetical protein
MSARHAWKKGNLGRWCFQELDNPTFEFCGRDGEHVVLWNVNEEETTRIPVVTFVRDCEPIWKHYSGVAEGFRLPDWLKAGTVIDLGEGRETTIRSVHLDRVSLLDVQNRVGTVGTPFKKGQNFNHTVVKGPSVTNPPAYNSKLTLIPNAKQGEVPLVLRIYTLGQVLKTFHPVTTIWDRLNSGWEPG